MDASDPSTGSGSSRAKSRDDIEARAKWAGWQQAHQQALTALQEVEATYHRLTAQQAFGRGDDETARSKRAEVLTRLEEMRVRLDEIREQQPKWPY
jgi:hypothetical protein